MAERMLRAVEVALLLNISVPTLSNWYKFKRLHPDNEMCKYLPEPEQKAARQTRYWKESDIANLLIFKSQVVMGRNGFMGSVTQQYAKKGK